MPRAAASCRWIRGALQRPCVASVVPSARGRGRSDRVAAARCRWRRALGRWLGAGVDPGCVGAVARCRRWLANWGTQQVLAGRPRRRRRGAGHGADHPAVLDRVAAGRRRLVVAGPQGRRLRQEPDGSLVDHADLRALDAGRNELVVDGRGRSSRNGGTDFHPGQGEAPRVPRPGHTGRRRAAGRRGLAFPNRMAVTPGRRDLIVSASLGGALTAFDIGPDGSRSNRRGCGRRCPATASSWTPEGAGWTPNRLGLPAGRRGGAVLATVPLDRAGLAGTLGAADRPTLCMLAADWRRQDGVQDTSRA
jgi:hypothetical protein